VDHYTFAAMTLQTHLRQPYSEKIFKIQKRVIRIITNSRMRDSCRELFQRLEILPLYSQYIFSLSIFVIKKQTSI